MIFTRKFHRDLRRDIKLNPNNLDQAKMRACRRRYTRFMLLFLANMIIAPFMYCAWWSLKKKISYKLYYNFRDFYKTDKLYNSFGYYEVDDIDQFYTWLHTMIMNSPLNNHKLDADIKRALGLFYYYIWLHGDDDDPLGRGGLPETYKSGKNTFYNRFMFGPIRNPWGNGIHLKMKSALIEQVYTDIDERADQDTTNYGTSNARVGTYLRWYVDHNGDYWYMYERVYLNRILGWRDFYFGGVGCLALPEGTVPTHSRKCTRWEYSNRECDLV